MGQVFLLTVGRFRFQTKPFSCILNLLLCLSTPHWGNFQSLQIHRGIHILTEIEQNIYNGTDDVMDLSNQFYSVIPVAFGSQIDKSYTLDTLEKVQERKEWLHGIITANPTNY